ncbi:MAG: hypothetical protein JST00_22170 [Deltaproteobacteria bacterium]|nr:hypothetical protein [Deltaproteobacteria bacterium]
MTRRILLGALLFAIALAPGCSGCGKPPPIPLDVPEQPPGTLLFPPAEDGWLERAPLDLATGRSSRNEIRVTEPKLDANGRFQASGTTVSISFDKEAISDVATKTAPLVAISPSHPGRTVWVSKQTVEFRADKPFDPETEYTATLPELTGPTGNKLTGGFKGTFKATPETTIAGKIVHWIPKPGEPRVVYVRPIDDRDIGPKAKLLVIWDQPIDDAKASKAVSMKTERGAPVALTMTRPAPGETFEGEKVDTRSIAQFSLAAPPPPGTKLSLEARDHDPSATPTKRTLTVRPLPKLDSLSCSAGWSSSGKDCEVKGTTLKGSSASTVTFHYTNRIVNEQIDKHVTVTPAPPKLRIGGWGEDVNIDAAWAPSATYQIRVSNLVDRFGYRVADVSATFTTLPRSASAILREGVLVMDEAGAHDFYVTTRNVKKGELLVWPVAQGSEALVAALEASRNNKAPSGTPKVFTFDGAAAPHVYERATVDLVGKLEPGHLYLAQVRVKETALGAEEAPSSQPSVPLIMMAGKETPGAHVHVAGQKALVQVYRFGSGEAVGGASVVLGPSRATTDDKGIAVLDLPARRSEGNPVDVVTVRAGNEEAVLPLDRNATSASEVYPELTTNDAEGDREMLGFLVTDRGIYRPGDKLHVKGFVRKATDKKIGAVPSAKVVLKIKDPLDAELVSETMTTSDAGTITKEIELPKPGHTGRHRIRLELDDQAHTTLAEEVVRVAEFETPRFKVDVDAPHDMPAGRWKSKVVGRYFFGAPMDGARVEWTIRKKRRDVEVGKPLDAAGFSFGQERNPFDAASETAEERPRVGSGKLGRDGALDVDVELGPLTKGPTDVTFEADVSDESYRHVAGKKTVLEHPFPRYGGLRLATRFGGVGPVKVDLAAVDTKGNAVTNVAMEARLERLEWKKSAVKAESGAVVETWGTVVTPEGTCTVTIEPGPNPWKGCDLATKRPGEYRVVARIDGRDDATASFYAWGNGGDGSGEAPAVPSMGKRTPVSTDKKKYAPGDVAKILVQSPFAEATAILTMERGGILSHEARRFKGSSTVFDVPLSIAHAPHAHAVVTLLPMGGTDGAYRVGAVRLPVALDTAKLTVKVRSDRKTYDVKETAEVTVEVMQGDRPIRNADVTLAVVDEAVLRLTDFHAKDPLPALHPARALAFSASDSRAFLFRRKEKAHVAGGGGADDRDSIDTRKDFVETVAWLPALTTDERGRVTAKVRLPDNLTELRMMATVVADDGAAGVAEDRFVVTRPFLLEPVIPAFALKGDKLELAAMVHNNTASPVNAKVKIDGETREVSVPANGRQRVAIPLVADKWRESTFTLEVDGKAKDRVVRAIRVGLPGTEEHPQLAGVFRDKQEITLAIPADAIFDDDAKLVLKTGAALYPELGQRLLYLQGYPHGCLEQTTSGLLPLLAAQNLIPWTGVIDQGEDERKKRVAAGVKRLASMKLMSGGLSMWPGGNEVHLYGTIYAARALLLAKKMGIEEEGLVSSVLGYLSDRLRHEREPVLKVAIADVLAMAEKLEPDVADALMDTKDRLDVYGVASLALALSAIPKQGERVKGLLDELEASFDAQAAPKGTHGERDHSYWGSADRDRAQTLLALVKLRKTSKLTDKLAHRLIRSVESYTTQGTAWSLVALASYVGTDRPNGSVDVKIKAEGLFFDRLHSLGGENKEVGIALKELRGKKVLLQLEGDATSPCSFAMEARYVRPDGASTKHARRAPLGPSVYRVYTDPKGRPLDLSQVKAGDVVRVALRIEIPKLDGWRASYLAVTDRFGAGLSPVQPDLATVAQADGVEKDHPFYDGLSGWGGQASYVDVRDDRVNVYFDRVYGSHAAYATYLVRAVTPGEFFVPAAVGELMYEPGSFGYSDSSRVTIK